MSPFYFITVFGDEICFHQNYGTDVRAFYNNIQIYKHIHLHIYKIMYVQFSLILFVCAKVGTVFESRSNIGG